MNVHDYLADLDSEGPLYMKVRIWNVHDYLADLDEVPLYIKVRRGMYMTTWQTLIVRCPSI